MAVPPALLAHAGSLLAPETRVLAHAGGFSWDEALLVMAPLVVIGALLWLANRRAARLAQDDATPAAGPPEPGVDAAEPAPPPER